VPWIKKNSDKKVQEQQGPRRTTKYHGLQERVGRDRLAHQEMGEVPGPTARCGEPRGQVYH